MLSLHWSNLCVIEITVPAASYQESGLRNLFINTIKWDREGHREGDWVVITFFPGEEPTDEMLVAIMREAADEAVVKKKKADERMAELMQVRRAELQTKYLEKSTIWMKD